MKLVSYLYIHSSIPFSVCINVFRLRRSSLYSAVAAVSVCGVGVVSGGERTGGTDILPLVGMRRWGSGSGSAVADVVTRGDRVDCTVVDGSNRNKQGRKTTQTNRITTNRTYNNTLLTPPFHPTMHSPPPPPLHARKRLGAHVSAAGGVQKAIQNAINIHANAFA